MALPRRVGAVAALGSAQDPGLGVVPYLPAMLAVPMARNKGTQRLDADCPKRCRSGRRTSEFEVEPSESTLL